MTRETKIGLLVGLAFIIVIGILLSDHINTTTDPVAASTTGAAENVRESVRAPGATDPDIGKMTVVAPQKVIPSNPVVTQRETPPPNPGVTIVDVGPNSDPSRVRLAPRPAPRDPAPPQSQTNLPEAPAAGTDIGVSDPGTSAVAGAGKSALDRLREVARQNGMEVVPQDEKPFDTRSGQGTSGNGQSGTTGANSRSSVPAGYRQVKAEDGETVSKLAARYMGGNTKANREAIIRANPSMTPDGHLLIAGRTYLIPTGASTVGAPMAQSPPQSAQRPAASAAAAPPGFAYYTVKENDKLWRIAAEQLGSGTRWTEIRELNEDVLKNGEQLQIGMRLKLPPKAVATSN